MYERNAIVIDRFFANAYGYTSNNNIKNNSNNYFELVDVLERYQDASERENEIMAEFEKVANKIGETKKLQETLYKKAQKISSSRQALFENLDEDDGFLDKQFKKFEAENNKNEDEIKTNSEKFVEEIKEFHEKSEVRNQVGKERRLVENEYQKKLNYTIDNFNNINKDKLKDIKTFIKSESKEDAKLEIKTKIAKNGAKEKVPFDINVINAAIDISLDIEEKKAEVLMSLYDKTMRLLEEIKADTVKIERHKKIVTDSKSRLEFLGAVSEYIILFLDNERMNTIGGQEEHEKAMLEACDHLEKDLMEITNMYTLLAKEIAGKASKKAYKELYNLEYLLNLQDEEKKFETSVRALNMVGTVIYPDYWRLEGMQKIYETFKNILTYTYDRDLKEFEPLDITFGVKDDILNENEENEEQEEIIEKEEIETPVEREKFEDSIDNRNEFQLNRQIDDDEEIEIPDDETYSDTEKELDEIDEEFHWDDDEDDELGFGGSYILDDKEEETKQEEPRTDLNEYYESKRDEEIDKVLGFFGSDDENKSETENDVDDIGDEIEDDGEPLDEEALLSSKIDEDLTDDIFDDIEENKDNIGDRAYHSHRRQERRRNSGIFRKKKKIKYK